MQNYFKLVRLLSKDAYKIDGKKQRYMVVIFALLYIMLLSLALIVIFAVKNAVLKAGIVPQFLTFYYFIVFLLVIIFGTIASIHYLFMSKDSEFFLSLPIKSSTVFMAKLTVVYLGELALSAAFLVPCLILSGILFNLGGVFYIVLSFAVLAAPVVPMLIIALISVPITALMSFFKNRGAAGSVVVIALFAVGFSLYLGFYTSAVADAGDGSGGMDAFKPFFNTISRILYPLFMLMKVGTGESVFGFSMGVSALIEILIFLGGIGVIFILAYVLSLLLYKKTVSRLLENRGTGIKIKGVDKHTPVLKSLIIKEWKEVVRTPSMALQVFSTAAICPVIMFMFSFFMKDLFLELHSDDLPANFTTYMAFFINYMMILMLAVGANMGAMLCISREGKNIEIIKSIPVSYDLQVKAKKYFYAIISFSAVILSIVAMTIAMIINNTFIWWLPIFTLAGVLPLAYMTNAIYVYQGLKKPFLTWKSYRELTRSAKSSIAAIIFIFGAMFYSGTVITIFSLLAFVINPGIVAAIILLIPIVPAVLISRYVDEVTKRNAPALIEKMQA